MFEDVVEALTLYKSFYGNFANLTNEEFIIPIKGETPLSFDDEDDEEFGLFSDVLIDNPLLDSIDPDGAAERFPELARDPQFWLDMVLFIAFLNWLSDVGPQDYFPDIPYYVWEAS